MISGQYFCTGVGEDDDEGNVSPKGRSVRLRQSGLRISHGAVVHLWSWSSLWTDPAPSLCRKHDGVLSM